MGGGANSGVSCVVKNAAGRQEFYILKYSDIERAVDFWRDWISSGNYVTRRRHVMIISQGGGSGADESSYTYRWAKYAANHVDGRLVGGY
jgi:hypothetical protein